MLNLFFFFKAIFNLSQVSDKLLIKDPTLLGANYIKFISAGKFLCIDSQNRLIAQVSISIVSSFSFSFNQIKINFKRQLLLKNAYGTLIVNQ